MRLPKCFNRVHRSWNSSSRKSFDCKSGPNEIIQHNKNGFLVRHLDVQDLKDKISQILITNFNREDVIHTVKKNQINNISTLYEKLIISLMNN